MFVCCYVPDSGYSAVFLCPRAVRSEMLELISGKKSHMRSGVRLQTETVSLPLYGCLRFSILRGMLKAVVLSEKAAEIGDVVFRKR